MQNLTVHDGHRRMKLSNRFVPLLENFLKTPIKRNNFDYLITLALSAPRLFIAEHSNVVIIKADKGNAVVALNKKDYISKLEILINDKDTYLIVNRNPDGVLNKLHDLITRY